MHAAAAEPGRARLRIADATATVPSGLASFGHASHFITFQGWTFSSHGDPQERAAITDSIKSMLTGIFAQKGERKRFAISR
jgi:hypothetical protein